MTKRALITGILFNPELPIRSPEFVTRKIAASLARIRNGQKQVLELGNLDAKRDRGFAGDYVVGMWRMLQQPEADDYLLATGETRSVRAFVEQAAAVAGYDLAWEGEAEKAIGIDKKTNKTILRVNPDFYRPAEVELLIGNPATAHDTLGWAPRVSFEKLVEVMVRSDLDRAREGRLSF